MDVCRDLQDVQQIISITSMCYCSSFQMSKEVMLQDHSKEALPDVLKVYKQVFVLSDKFVSILNRITYN